ncbi:MAG: exodeoxyribonuclease III [Thermoplasmata archaeon]|nr:exodeoxyribonuclease III [Thermoplasmata archaeon]
MNTLQILSWNVNGLRAVLNKGFVRWLGQAKPDILCLQETRVTEAQLPSEIKNVQDYEIYFNVAEKKGYSGVGLFTKKRPVSIERGLGLEKFDAEGRVIIADYDDFILFNVYFPNGRSSPERLNYKMEFYDAFLKYVNNLKNEGKNLIICGDVNTAHHEIDLAHPKENSKNSGFLPIEREWLDKLLANGFIDTFRLFNKYPENYTWWDYKTHARERNVGWRLDYFFISANLQDNLKSAFILPDVMGSDHCPIGIEIVDIG